MANQDTPQDTNHIPEYITRDLKNRGLNLAIAIFNSGQYAAVIFRATIGADTVVILSNLCGTHSSIVAFSGGSSITDAVVSAHLMLGQMAEIDNFTKRMLETPGLLDSK